jgi:hypothetical protein
MEYGAHLPLIEFDGARRSLAELRAYALQAAALDYRFLCVNDHLLFARPWLDGPTAPSVGPHVGEIELDRRLEGRVLGGGKGYDGDARSTGGSQRFAARGGGEPRCGAEAVGPGFLVARTRVD